MNRKGQRAYRKNAEILMAVDDLIDDICEKAEKERDKNFINDDGDLWMLMVTLQDLNTYVDKANKCKSVNAVNKLRKKMKFALA